MTTPREIERRMDRLEPDDEDDVLTVRINHEHVDENGEVMHKETEVIRLGTTRTPEVRHDNADKDDIDAVRD